MIGSKVWLTAAIVAAGLASGAHAQGNLKIGVINLGRVVEGSPQYAAAKKKIDPFAEGQWRKFEAELNGSKPAGLLPASPDDWLAVLLR
jgi:Skp family chaperone for outer membrane proteins